MTELIITILFATLFVQSTSYMLNIKSDLRNKIYLITSVLIAVIIYLIPTGMHVQYQYISLHFSAMPQALSMIIALLNIALAGFSMMDSKNIEKMALQALVLLSILCVNSHNIFSMLTFMEVMGICSGTLVMLNKQADSLRISINYILIHFIAGLFVLAGLSMYIVDYPEIVYGPIRNLSNYLQNYQLPTVLIFIGLVINTGLFPFSFWINATYKRLNFYVPAYLCITSTKVSLFFVMLLFANAHALIYVGYATALFALFATFVFHDLRNIIFYFMISSIGVITASVGIGGQETINAAFLYMLNHMFYTTMVLMAIGMAMYVLNNSSSFFNTNLLRCNLITYGAIVLFLCNVSTLPFTSNYIFKNMLKQSIYESQHYYHYLFNMFLMSGYILSSIRILIDLNTEISDELFKSFSAYKIRWNMNVSLLSLLVLIAGYGLIYPIVTSGAQVYSLKYLAQNINYIAATIAIIILWNQHKTNLFPMAEKKYIKQMDILYLIPFLKAIYAKLSQYSTRIIKQQQDINNSVQKVINKGFNIVHKYEKDSQYDGTSDMTLNIMILLLLLTASYLLFSHS